MSNRKLSDRLPAPVETFIYLLGFLADVIAINGAVNLAVSSGGGNKIGLSIVIMFLTIYFSVFMGVRAMRNAVRKMRNKNNSSYLYGEVKDGIKVYQSLASAPFLLGFVIVAPWKVIFSYLDSSGFTSSLFSTDADPDVFIVDNFFLQGLVVIAVCLIVVAIPIFSTEPIYHALNPEE